MVKKLTLFLQNCFRSNKEKKESEQKINLEFNTVYSDYDNLSKSLFFYIFQKKFFSFFRTFFTNKKISLWESTQTVDS